MGGHRGVMAACVLVLAVLLGGAEARAAVIDPGYGANGTRVLPHDVRALITIPTYLGDGYLVAGSRRADGFASVTRLTKDGDPDPRFGTNGLLESRFGTTGTFVWDAALGTDGRVVLSGFSQGQSFVARTFPSGSIDTTFGQGGIVFLPDPSGAANTFAAHVGADLFGNIVVMQDISFGSTGGAGYRLLRLTSKGQLDTTFGNGGIVDLDIGIKGDLVVKVDGTIFVAGQPVPGNSGAVRVRKFDSLGRPVSAFGAAGVADIDRSPLLLSVSALAVDPSGRILVGGDARGPLAGAPGLVMRLSDTGALDPTFGESGLRLVNETPTTSTVIDSIDADANGILVGGYTRTSATNALVARLTNAGTLDPAFAAEGYVLSGSNPSVAHGVAISGSRYLVATSDGQGGTVTGWVDGSVPPLSRAIALAPVSYQGEAQPGGRPLTFGPAIWGGGPASVTRRLEVCGFTCVTVVDQMVTAGMSALTYAPSFNDVGAQIVYTELASNDAAVTGSRVSTPTVVPGSASSFYTDGFRAEGSATVGGLVSLPGGTWGSSGFIRVSWRRCVPQTTSCTALTPPGFQFSYAPTAADVGSEIVLVAHVQNRWTTFEILAPPVGPVTGNVGGGGGGGSNLPDLELVQIADRGTAAIGDQVTFTGTVTLKNFKASSGASNLVLTDALPANVEVVDVSTNRGGCVIGRTTSCNLGFIASGITAQVRVTVKVTGPGEIANTMIVKADEAELDPSNNTATVRVNTPVLTPPVSPVPLQPTTVEGITQAGASKPDTLRGTAFADTLDGRGGPDRIFGYAGNDLLIGGLGADTIGAGKGKDTIRVRDGQKDVVDCGPGVDTVIADKLDVLTGCEKALRN